jgi:amino acid transporter
VGTLALVFALERLAAITSTITLGVFTLVNLALWRLKQQAPAPEGIWQAPAWVPVAGFVVSLGFVSYGVARLAGLTG